MEPVLYNRLLTNDAFIASMTKLDKAVAKDLAKSSYPRNAKAPSEQLSVSFPNLAGIAKYVLEVSKGREFVGNAYALSFNISRAVRIGVVKVTLFEDPLLAVAEGVENIERLEVLFRNEIIGVATGRKSGNEQVFSVRTPALEQEWSVSIGLKEAVFKQGDSLHRFPLILDLGIPFIHFFTRKPQRNPNLIYDGQIASLDPKVLMCLLLMHRMCFSRIDF